MSYTIVYPEIVLVLMMLDDDQKQYRKMYPDLAAKLKYDFKLMQECDFGLASYTLRTHMIKYSRTLVKPHIAIGQVARASYVDIFSELGEFGEFMELF